MDPASAGVAFVGFTASVITIAGFVAHTSQSLYDFKRKLKNAPGDLERLCRTIEQHAVLAEELKRHMSMLEETFEFPSLRALWQENTRQLDTDIQSFAKIIEDLERRGSRAGTLKLRARLFLAEDSIAEYSDILSSHIRMFTFMQSLISDHRLQKIVSDVASLSCLYRNSGPLSHHYRQTVKPRKSQPSSQQPGDPDGSQSTVLGLYLTPFGYLTYSRHVEIHASEFSVLHTSKSPTVSKNQRITLEFIPMFWFSRYRLAIEMQFQSLILSGWKMQLKQSPYLSRNKTELCKSLGFVLLDSADGKRFTCVKPNPVAVRQFLQEGDLRASDHLQEVGGRYGILSGLLGALEITNYAQYDVEATYEVCNLLLENGAEPDSETLLESALHACYARFTVFNEKDRPMSYKLPIERSIPSLLLKHGAIFKSSPQKFRRYSDRPEGILAYLLPLPNSFDHIRSDFLQFLDPSMLQELVQIDRWLLGTLCHTMPGFSEALRGQLGTFAPRLSLDEFSIDKVYLELRCAQAEDRCRFLGTISSVGTAAQLFLFMSNGFDISEELPDLEEVDLDRCGLSRPYLVQAAAHYNNSTFNILCKHGAKVSTTRAFAELITTDLVASRIREPGFLQMLFALGPKQGPSPDQFFGHFMHFRFYSIYGAREYPDRDLLMLVDTVIQNGYGSFCRPPYSMDYFLGADVQAIAYSVAPRGWKTPTAAKLVGQILAHLIYHHKARIDYRAAERYPSESFKIPRWERYTALEWALVNGNVEIVKIFIAAGIQQAKLLTKGLSALEMADQHINAPHPRNWNRRPMSSWGHFVLDDRVSLEVDEEIYGLVYAAIREESDQASSERLSDTGVDPVKQPLVINSYRVFMTRRLGQLLSSLEDIGIWVSTRCCAYMDERRRKLLDRCRYRPYSELPFWDAFLIRSGLLFCTAISFILEVSSWIDIRIPDGGPQPIGRKAVLLAIVIALWAFWGQ